MPYEITSPAAIYCGAGTFGKIADEATRLGSRAGIITGTRLSRSQRIGDLIEDLRKRGVPAFLSEPVTDEPTVDTIDELAAFLRQSKCEVVIAIGGGSVIDSAKAAAVMATNDGKTEAYQIKRREITNPPLPQIAVPTTAGTGSEATRVSVLTNNNLGIKRSISHPLMTPNVAVLDPELTVSLPKYLTTTTAMDAFAHSIESAVSRSSDSYTRHIALAAIEQLSQGLPVTQEHPNDLDARLKCLLGSCFAGLSMQRGLGASHSLAPAVCIVGEIRHSEAIAALLPHSIELNERLRPGTYDEVKRAMGCEDAAKRLTELCLAGGFSPNLSQFNMKPEDWNEVLAALNRYGSHRQTNPVDVTDDYARELYEMSVGKK